METYDCELVLRQNGSEERRPHQFMAEIKPGAIVHLEGADWVVLEVNERLGRPPEVVSRPVSERY